MRIRFDNILLCILWLLAVTLGTCFWFNIAFGFDIFSATHWGYVASMQASQTPIKTGFYISIAIVIFVTLFGLYLILRPRIRRIRLPIVKTSQPIPPTQPVVQTAVNQSASTLDILPSETRQNPVQQSNTPGPSSAERPPRLSASLVNTKPITQPVNSGVSQPMSNIQVQQAPKQNWSELNEIFSAVGYTVKPTPRVNGIQTSLLAIGSNETMWIGCVGIKTTDVRAIMNRFDEIFTSTLEESEIEINGFVIAAPDAATSEFEDILMFDSISELREYMNNNPNPPTNDEEMFEAYSGYIDAVINHIGKV